MAGVSTKDIKNRIRSMENTRQITRAMEMVAAGKLRRAQNQVLAARPYFDMLYGVICDVARRNRGDVLPYFAPRNPADTPRDLYIVIAGDRGLAGGYNANVFKLCAREADASATILPIGKKALEHFRGGTHPLFADLYGEAAALSVGDCFTMSKAVCAAFRRGEFDRVFIVYTRFVSVLSQLPQTARLLPLESAPTGEAPEADILYEPSAQEVFERVIPEYLGGMIYGALCESRASEQAARRTAMDAATQNADEMIDELSLKYNQARQAAITQEITEIVAGV